MLGAVQAGLLIQPPAGPIGADLPQLENLLAYYKCDEGSGTTIQDHSGKNNHGTFTGLWGVMPSGKTAVEFTRASGQKIKPPVGAIPTGNAYTFACALVLDTNAHTPTNQTFFGSGVYPTNYSGMALTRNFGLVSYMPMPNISSWSGATQLALPAVGTEMLLVLSTGGGSTTMSKKTGDVWNHYTGAHSMAVLNSSLEFFNNPNAQTATVDGKVRDVCLWGTKLTLGEVELLATLLGPT